MAFDIEGARRAGYSDDEIADHLGQQSGLDTAAARAAGYTTRELLGELSSAWAKQDLPAGVQPSTAGAGRGMVQPPSVEAVAPASAAPARRGSLRTVKPYGAGDERVQAPVGSVFDGAKLPAPEQSLIEQRGAPVSDEVVEAMRNRLSAMPAAQRRGVETRADLPAWMRDLAAKINPTLDQSDAVAAAAKVPGWTAESRARALTEQGVGGDIAPNIAAAGTGSVPQATALRGLDAAEYSQARAEGQAQRGGSIADRAMASAGEGFKQAGAGLAATLLRAAGDTEAADAMERAGFRARTRADGINELATMRQNAERMGVQAERPASYLEDMAVGGARSAGELIPALGAAAATTAVTKNPVQGARVAMGLMSGQVFGQEYVEGRAQGLTPGHAVARAGSMAALEYLGERYGLIPQAMRAIAGQAAKKPLEELPAFLEKAVAAMERRGLFKEPMGQVVRGQLGEQVGEQITGAGQYLVDGTALGLDRPMSLGEFFGNAIDTAVQTAMATGILQAGGAALKAAAGRRAAGQPAAAEPAPPAAPPTSDALAPLDLAPAPATAAVEPSAAPGSIEADLGDRLAAQLQIAPGPTPEGAPAPAPIDASAHEAATSPMNDRPEPTQAQKEAGNYKVGRARIAGLDISIENPEGSTRRGVAPDGTPWENRMAAHYGYVRGTRAGDGDHSDVFVKPGTPSDYSGPVFVIDQVDPATGRFDEHKSIIGAANADEARQIYLANYAPGWQGLGAITELPIAAYSSWVRDGVKRKPLGDIHAAARTDDRLAADASLPDAGGRAGDDASGSGGAAGVRAEPLDGRDAAAAAAPGAGPVEGGALPDGRGADGALTAVAASSEPETQAADASPQQAPIDAPAAEAPAAVAAQARAAEADVPRAGSARVEAAGVARNARFPRIETVTDVSVGPGGYIEPRPIAPGKPLYRETSTDGLDDLLRSDSQAQAGNHFVTDNQDLAIGQGANKGVMIEFRPDALGGREHRKPGTGDVAGREYRADLIAPRAVQAITMSATDVRALRGLTRRRLQQEFDRKQLPDGRVRFVRRGDAAIAPKQAEPGEDARALQDVQRAPQTETAAFKRWFGDSKVVDAEGKPLVVYHGTTADVAAFDAARSRDAGVWLTPIPGAAEMYSGAREGANLIPAYVALRNPYEASVGESRADALMRAADRGHDGIIVRDSDGSISTLAVFSPEQIKSAIGNSGAFDSGNPSIVASQSDGVLDLDAESDREWAGRLSEEVKRISASWKGGPRITVAQDVDGLPAEIQESLRSQNATGNVRALYMPDTGDVYLVAARLPTLDDAQQALFHEVMGHHGLRQVLGPKAYAEQMERLRLSNPALAQEARVWHKRYGEDNIRALLERGVPEADARRQVTLLSVEEALADRAGSGQQLTGFNAFVARLQRALRQIGLDRAADWLEDKTQSETLALLSRARRAVELGPSEPAAAGRPTSAAFLAADQGPLEDGSGAGQGTPPVTSREEVDAPPPAPPKESAARTVQRKLQDSLNRFTVVRDWATKEGVNLTPDSNVWEFEERMWGRMATRIEDFREGRVKPLVEKIQKAGYSMADIAEFLHAQHAAERNAQIAKLDPDTKNGSGMTDERAAEILAAADGELKALANEVRSITDDTRKTLLDAGIISQEMVDAWQGAYQHYVPLKGGDDAGAQQGTGKGLSVNGRQKRALGHGEREEHIVENILRDYERAVMLAEKNTVGHSLIAFALELGNEEIATIDKPEKRKVATSSTIYEVVKDGSMVTAFDTKAAADRFIREQGEAGMTVRPAKGDPTVSFMARPTLADNEVAVYVKGHQVRVQLNDPLLARAYQKLGLEHLNQIMRVNRHINAWLSKAYTGYNPEFLAVNVMRDMTTGLLNVTGKFGVGVAAKALTQYPRALATLFRYSWNRKATDSIRAYRAAGGTTGAAYLGDIERIGADIQAAYDNYQGALEAAQQGKPLVAARVALRKLLRLAVAWIEHMNAAGENAMRLAVFEAVRGTEGFTVNDAASAAKNSTVNFNRKGEWGPVLGAMYLFFNPAVQGTAALMDSFVKGQHREQLWGLTGMLAAAGYVMAQAQFGGDDDRDEWRNIPDHVKERNLIIRLTEKRYLTLPVPYGYAAFLNLGTAGFDLQHGAPADKVALKLANSLVSNFLPLNPLNGGKPELAGGIELLPGAIGGELMRAAIRSAANRNGLGGEIVPASAFDEGKPDNLKMYRGSKGSTYELLAREANLLTGGTKTQSGLVDVSPETLKFWTETVTGGSGKFAVGMLDAGRGWWDAWNETDPELKQAAAPELREIPVIRRLARDEDVRDVRRAYYEATSAADEAWKNFERARKAGDLEGVKKVRAEQEELLGFAEAINASRRQVKVQRDVVQQVLENEQLSTPQKRLEVTRLERAELRLYNGMLDAMDRRHEAVRGSAVRAERSAPAKNDRP